MAVALAVAVPAAARGWTGRSAWVSGPGCRVGLLAARVPPEVARRRRRSSPDAAAPRRRISPEVLALAHWTVFVTDGADERC